MCAKSLAPFLESAETPLFGQIHVFAVWALRLERIFLYKTCLLLKQAAFKPPIGRSALTVVWQRMQPRADPRMQSPQSRRFWELAYACGFRLFLSAEVRRGQRKGDGTKHVMTSRFLRRGCDEAPLSDKKGFFFLSETGGGIQ